MFSLEAEKNVIGGILLDSRLLPLISGLVGESDFFDEKHRHIFRSILDLDAS